MSGYKPILREPLDTTAGGKQAVQHMVFEPQIEGDPVLTVGYVNVVTKTAKLRTFDCLEEMFAMRFPKRDFHLDPRGYQDFFDLVAKFMRRQACRSRSRRAPPWLAAHGPRASEEHRRRAAPVVHGRGARRGGTAAVYMRITGKL